MQQGYYLRLVGPNFVYVKYRCSRCKKLGEQFVRQAEWESGILDEVLCEASADELKRFDELGPIDIHECIDAHFELENIQSLEALKDTLPQTKS